MTDARVILWGTAIGAVSWDEARQVGVFQYEPEFIQSGIELSPFMMPLRIDPYEFPGLAPASFRGLPGLLADSLPDKFGNAVIDAWLASQGRAAGSFNPVERLCYIGTRGMGALEYQPAILRPLSAGQDIEISKLVELSNRVLDTRTNLSGMFSGKDDSRAMNEILRVGTSAGGARAKAILAWNPATNEFRSGQAKLQPGFEHWIMKFDGISNNRDKEIADPQDFGRIEYAYHRMAVEAGIEMTECRLHHEGGRSHFMTRRFDRLPDDGKLHMQSLGAISHLDFNEPALYSYEEALQIMKRLALPQADLEQLVLRGMFNVVGRNHDDHVKNIAFLMNRRGEWRLSPAFDVTYAFDPAGAWTRQHQMSINGKRDEFQPEDLYALAAIAGIKKAQAKEMLERVTRVVSRWPEFAHAAGVEEEKISRIGKALRGVDAGTEG
jgi:serine/threonine-protein kinase HipA